MRPVYIQVDHDVIRLKAHSVGKYVNVVFGPTESAPGLQQAIIGHNMATGMWPGALMTDITDATCGCVVLSSSERRMPACSYPAPGYAFHDAYK